MDKVIFTTLNSMKLVQSKQTNNAHDIANISTPGFKRAYWNRVETVDVVSNSGLNTRAMPIFSAENVVDLRPGPLMTTGRDLDVYLADQAVMAVQAAGGEEVYTRRGDLSISATGILQTGRGTPVLGDEGVITLPPGTHVSIGEDGSISMKVAGDSRQSLSVGRIKLANAAGESLYLREDGLYATADGPLPADGRMRLSAGRLEGSNVNAIDVMVNMIHLSRQYEMSVQMVKYARELDNASANTLRLT